MMALMFIMALMATNWELFNKSKSKSEKRNLVLLDLLASPQVIREQVSFAKILSLQTKPKVIIPPIGPNRGGVENDCIQRYQGQISSFY